MAIEGATDTIHEGCNCENCPRAMRGALTAAFPHIVSAKDAEIAKWERLRKALEPFASFGDVADDLMRDRICDWFGPSDFTAARDALGARPEPPCDTEDRT
jgi:hypothetical protein